MIKSYSCTLKACYLGYITQAAVNNFLPLLFIIFKNSFGISLNKITLLITINFLIQLIVDLISAKLINRIGYRTGAAAAHFLATAGLAGLAFFPYLLPSPFAGILICVIIYAVGGGLIEVLISPIAEACPTENKASVMSLLHSFYCWGTVLVVLISTLFMKLAGTGSWRLLSCIWSLLPLVNAFLFLNVPIASLTEEGQELSVRELFSKKLFPVFLLMMLAAGASEQAMSQWASAFAESGLGISKAAGDIAGPCLFSVLMGSARVLYARYSNKLSLTKALIGCGALCITSYLIAALSPVPVVSLAACAVCGLSVGILWPGVFSAASAAFPKGGTAMFAILALAGDLGCSGGPALAGIVSGAFGDNLRCGIGISVVFPVMLIVCTMIYKKIKKI